ncbi:MAG: PH domain-containing protein [Lachnospiraceae bacterium]|nr:PH domain-containing protein [Lachnospiraceae bacterium]
MADIQYKWFDRKRTIFGLPLSFTKYAVTDEKLIIKTGFFNTKEEEIRLYRIMDVTLNRSLGERMFKLGTIHVISSDKSTPAFDIKRIKKSPEVKEIISDLVETARKKNRVSAREFMMADDVEDMDEDIDM